MNTGAKVALVTVGVAAVGGGAYYLVEQRRAAASGSGSTGSAGSSGLGSLFGPGVSGAANLGGAHANAAGGSVRLTAPTSASVGNVITLTASAANIANPVYQFWYLDPAHSGPANGWTPSGAYSATASFSFTPSEQGTYEVIAYARSASAPSHESASERPVYEAASDTYAISVS